MERVTVTETRVRLAALLDRVAEGERIAITRDGEEVAALLRIDDAVWCSALADRFRERRPPFTQPALDAWLDEVLASVDVGELMGEQED